MAVSTTLVTSLLKTTCEPLFKLLRKDELMIWNNYCQIAFEKIKTYLLNPPILVTLVLGRPLLMHLPVHETSIGCLLGQHDESGKKGAIYYLSKKFAGYESQYSTQKKTCCAFTWATQRLRHYMLYLTKLLIFPMDPIKYFIEKPALSNRLAWWHLLLTEFDITYVTQKAVKRQATANQLARNRPMVIIP